MKKKIIASILVIILFMIQLIPIQYAVTEQESTGQENTGRENTEQENTERGNTEQENTEQENTEQENTEQGNTEQENTEQGNTEQGNTEQENTEQENTEQENTEQGNTKQDNTDDVNLKTKLSIVQKASEKKYLENDQGYISKEITNIDEENGEVTIELKLSNTTKDIELKNNPAIMLVIDNSPSMDFVTSNGSTRKEIVINSAKNLVNSIFNNTSEVKIGIVDFHGVNGWFGSAGISNATLRQELTNDKNTIMTDLDRLNSASTVSGTNIDAGLQRAERNFTTTCENKIIVLFTDGVPNADVKGNESSNDVATEKAILIQNNTKETLQRIESSGISIISMMTGVDESDGNVDKNGNVYQKINTIEEELAAIERVFGTMQNPTAGKYYLAKAADIKNIIEKDIFSDVMEKVQNPMHAVKIVDYFPKDITENFEFEYVGDPSIGNISDTIDKETKTITWDIETLRGNEVATVKYKLKMKNMKNKDLLNKTISTNEKVVLTYKDIEEKEYEVILTSSPKIQLTEIKDTIPGGSQDTTIAPGKIAQAGISDTLKIVIFVILGIGMIAFIRYKSLKEI